MARHTKAEAARLLGISRTTLYKLIDQGQVSVTADGLIDDTALVRAAPYVDILKDRTRTSMDSQSMDAQRQDDAHHDLSMDTHDERQWTDVHARQWTSTEDLVNELRAQVQDLREQRQELRNDLREAHEKERLLLEMLQAERTRYDRLLEAPRQAPVPPPTAITSSERTADRGEMRRQIVALLREYLEGLSRHRYAYTSAWRNLWPIR